MESEIRLKDSRLAPHLALVAVQIMFGTWPIVGKVALRAISITGLVALRVIGAGICLVTLRGRLKELRAVRRVDLAWLGVCSLLGVVLNQLLFVKGLSLTTVINSTLLSTTIPVFTLAVSIALGYDQISLRRTVGILLAAGGVVYLVDPFRADFSHENTVGNLLIVANSLCYGAYIAISKDLFERYGALNVITWLFVIGSVCMLPIAIYDLSEDHLRPLGPAVWLVVLYIIMVPTVTAYYLNAWALTRVSPGTVATYIYLQPLIAFGLAPLLLGESWNSRTVLASAFIFAGVGVVTKRGRSRAVKEVAKHPDAIGH